MGRATASRGAAGPWRAGFVWGQWLRRPGPAPPEPRVCGPGGGAASAEQREWRDRSQAALNKIRGKCPGPREHRVLPPAGRSEEAQKTLNVPSDTYRTQGPEATRAPATPGGQLHFSEVGAQPDLGNDTNKPNQTNPFPGFSSMSKGKFLLYGGKKRKGQDPRKLSSLWTRREGEYAFCFFFVSGSGGRKLDTYFLKIPPSNPGQR